MSFSWRTSAECGKPGGGAQMGVVKSGSGDSCDY
jgi:hypothetical protein